MGQYADLTSSVPSTILSCSLTMDTTATKIYQHLLGAHKIVIAPHQNPDGDAIGAATAFQEYLANYGKDAQIFCATPVNPSLHFLPHATEVTDDAAVFNNKAVDTIVVLDSGDLRYNGIANLVAGHPATLINIDHHPTNERYGHINFVMPTAASTTEILFHYFRRNRIHINHKMATSLLTGLSTDTGNFTNAATSVSALAASAELLSSGGNFNLVTHETLANKSISALRLWGLVSSRLERDTATGLTSTYMTQEDLKRFMVPDSEAEGISNFLNNLENTPIALVLRELPDGQIKGSFRTTHDDIDVSSLAKQLGGGGHKKAAGFTQPGPIEAVLQKIRAMLSGG